MGAQFDCRRYYITDKQDVRKLWVQSLEQDLYDNGHSYSGTIGMLGPDVEWRTEKFELPEDARTFIENNHEKWEPPMAVAWGNGWMIGGWCSS